MSCQASVSGRRGRRSKYLRGGSPVAAGSDFARIEYRRQRRPAAHNRAGLRRHGTVEPGGGWSRNEPGRVHRLLRRDVPPSRRAALRDDRRRCRGSRPLPPAEVMKRGTRQRWRRMAGQCAAAAVILAAAGGIAANATASRSPRLVPPAVKPASGSTSTPSPSPRLPSPTPSRHHPAARPRPNDVTHGQVPTSIQVTVTPSGFVVAPTPTAQAPTHTPTPSPTPTPSSSS